VKPPVGIVRRIPWICRGLELVLKGRRVALQNGLAGGLNVAGVLIGVVAIGAPTFNPAGGT